MSKRIINVHDRRYGWIGEWDAEPFDINALTDADIGRTVIYIPARGFPEAGTLSSWRLGMVFVRFSRGTTAAGCKPQDLMMAVRPRDGDKSR
jgi:hypothetical protein